MTRHENLTLNHAEIQARRPALVSTPPYVTIGTHFKCNADCVFCLGGDFPDFTLEVYRTLFERKMGEVLRRADHIGFCGYGETLLMPGIERFLDHISTTLPDSTKVFTTNGIPLTEPVIERLTEGKYSLIISLHAANAALHERITRTRAFGHIVERIKRLTALARQKGNRLHINLVFLVTTLNIGTLPDFVRFAKEIGVERVTCNYLTIFEPHQLPLHPFFAREKTNEMFDRASEIAKLLDLTLVLPPRFARHAGPDHPCHDPWNFFYVETQGSVNPCCFAGNHIGYLTKDDFETIWNGPGYTALRKGLATGEIHTWCRYCYKHRADNVNDIRSHITFRPETQKKILGFLKEHRDEYPVPPETLEL